MVGKARNPARPNKDELEWQDKLIKNGYAARTIPRDYGGFGAEPDAQIKNYSRRVYQCSNSSWYGKSRNFDASTHSRAWDRKTKEILDRKQLRAK